MHTREMEIVGYDAIEFHVGNARQAAHYYRTGFGFQLVAYAGPETGVRDRVSYVLEQGAIRFVLTAGLTPEHPVSRWQRRHGDGVRDIAFRVPDAEAAFALATERGAVPLQEPEVLTDEHGKLTVAAIAVYGDTVHSLVQRDDYSGSYRPGFVAVPARLPGAGGSAASSEVGLHTIDHVVANVHLGDMDTWAAFYERILGFSQLRHFDDETISTEDTALMSRVLADGGRRVKLPINEPAAGRRRSQIEEYLDANRGAGVQHLALATDDIVGTVRALTARGIGFLDVPESYYQEVREHIGDVDESWDDLARCGILVDRDEEGYLLQIFTEPVQDRPTLFYEIIQRRGAQGFGVGNFRSLFAAVEREQARRGNL
jgi:4-hydroxyphenylpyruvate dioxygenase